MSDYLLDQSTEIYCHRLARIDHLGPNRRLIFVVPDVQGGQYQQVTIKLIMPAEALAALASMAEPTARERCALELLALETHTAN